MNLKLELEPFGSSNQTVTCYYTRLTLKGRGNPVKSLAYCHNKRNFLFLTIPLCWSTEAVNIKCLSLLV